MNNVVTDLGRDRSTNGQRGVRGASGRVNIPVLGSFTIHKCMS